MATDPLTTPVDQAETLLKAAPFFAGVPVHTERVGNITQTVTNALAKLGLAVTVLVPSIGDLKEVGSGFSAEMDLVIEVAELVAINQTGKTAWGAVGEVITAIHKQPNGLDGAGAAHRAGINEFRVNPDLSAKRQAHPRFLVYHVYATTRVRL